MWIRSQDKELLANVKNARVIYEFDSYHIVCDCEYHDAEFDEKTFDRLRKIHRYLEKSIKIAEGKKKNVKN